MEPALNPGDRPRRGLAIGLAVALVAAVVTVAAVVGTPERAEASGLARFTSCAELEAWGAASLENVRAVEEQGFDTVGDVVATSAAAAPELAAGAASTSDETALRGADGGAGTTNVVVVGVDELDLVDRVQGDTWLATSAGRLVLVDLAAEEIRDGMDVGWDAQVTYDPDAQIAWVVATDADGLSVEVRRVAVGATLEDAGRWTTSGMLVDARRVGDQLHLVATDGFVGQGGTQRPFAEGPVPCDQVLHPPGPSQPGATLLATLPASGDLQPVRVAEVVGAGQLVHVTTDAAYLATPQWEDDEPSTTIHRFDLASLAHTGSGRVPGSLLNDFSMSEHDGHLRVAITHGGGFGIARPVPMDGDGTGVIVDDVAVPEPDGDQPVSSDGSASDPVVTNAGAEPVTAGVAEPDLGTAETQAPEVRATVPEPTVPEPTVPETTVPEPTVPEPTVPEPTVPETTVPETTVPEPTVPEPEPSRILNQVFVLDIEGDLNVVGQTERFGLEDETLRGIRFDGATAYAVTFLETDPFYVLDLGDPASPAVVGEVKLPGFSAYLHPMGDGLVVGFGPGERAMTEAKLFDASDPSAPRLVDSIELGGDSPVVYDHHAFVDLGDGRFAVPVTSWNQPMSSLECLPTTDGTEPCVMPEMQITSEVVELSVTDGRLSERLRTEVVAGEPASRVIPISGGGWAVLAGQQLVLAGGPTLALS